MAELFKQPDKAGLPPGTPVHTGPVKTEPVKITLIQYDEAVADQAQVADVEEFAKLQRRPGVAWINVDGIHHVDVIEKMGAHFGLHPLILEDIVNTQQRPKLEGYNDYLYVVVKMLSHGEQTRRVQAEQVSLILGPDFVLSFQEQEGDVFDAIRERIRAGKGRIRTMGADYLLYALIDAVVDSYFAICEVFGDRLEEMESRAIANPEPETARRIHAMKREAILLRKALWPLREVVNGLLREDSPLVTETTRLYLRDVYDHTIQVIDAVESFRDMLGGLLDTYLSSLSNRMNEVMKVLTIIATIFIPLSFVAGVYGMNFDVMPELHWRWGYPAALLIMLGVAAALLCYFRKRKWV